jgi:hypothetical protein
MAPPKDTSDKNNGDIHLKPEQLIDTDVEEEFNEEGKKGFRKQTGTTSEKSDFTKTSKGDKGKPKPSNQQLEQEQSQMKMAPSDLKDTDAEDEFKEGGDKGFRKQTGKARL